MYLRLFFGFQCKPEVVHQATQCCKAQSAVHTECLKITQINFTFCAAQGFTDSQFKQCCCKMNSTINLKAYFCPIMTKFCMFCLITTFCSHLSTFINTLFQENKLTKALSSKTSPQQYHSAIELVSYLEPESLKML